MKIETFSAEAIDGETIIMRIDGNVIGFGNRFEENVRWHLHGMTGQYRQEKIRQAFEFFQSYASLFLRSEMAKVSECYRRAASQSSTSLRYAFWQYWEGRKIVQRGKVHQWV